MSIFWFLSSNQAKKRDKKFEAALAEQGKQLGKHGVQLEGVQTQVSALRARPAGDAPRSDRAQRPTPPAPAPPPRSKPVVDRNQQFAAALGDYYLRGSESALAAYNPVRVEFDVRTKVSGVEQRLNRADYGNYIVLEDHLLIPLRGNFAGDTVTADYLKQKCNMPLFFELVGGNFNYAQIRVTPAAVVNCGDYHEQRQRGRITGAGE